MDSMMNEIREEYFENEPQHVEAEEVSDVEPDGPKPWDPDLIRIHTKPFSLRQVVDMIAEGDIELAPDFQRLKVWKDRQKSRLIESILLGIPLPSFYFSEDSEGRMQVVDGLQRLSAIYAFVREHGFVLQDVEYLDEQSGKGFDELEPVFRRRFNNTQIFVNVIDPQTPWQVKFDVFRRINTGGSPLNAQEIRHCMSGPRARAFLKRCASSPAFHEATGGALRDHLRMADREVALRFCAFRLLEEEYRNHDSFDSFLGSTVEHLEQLDELVLAVLFQEFEDAMRVARDVFGRYAFRKWPLDVERQNPINRALFETWAVVLAERQSDEVLALKDQVVDRARLAMTEDLSFIASISTSTGDVAKVEKRFETVRTIVREALPCSSA